MIMISNKRGHKSMMLSDVCLSVSRVHRAEVENREAYEDQNWHRGSPRHT